MFMGHIVNHPYIFYLHITNDCTLPSVVPVLGCWNLLEISLKKFELTVHNLEVIDSDWEDSKNEGDESLPKALQGIYCVISTYIQPPVYLPVSKPVTNEAI
jgi:hypothetical protein